jgi:hypothetical protein
MRMVSIFDQSSAEDIELLRDQTTAILENLERVIRRAEWTIRRRDQYKEVFESSAHRVAQGSLLWTGTWLFLFA